MMNLVISMQPIHKTKTVVEMIMISVIINDVLMGSSELVGDGRDGEGAEALGGGGGLNAFGGEFLGELGGGGGGGGEIVGGRGGGFGSGGS